MGFTFDATREAGDELVEGFLVCRACLEAWPILGGSAILPADLQAHLVEQGSVYRRTPIGDPRVVRLVLGSVGDGVDMVPFEEVTARYGDLAAEPAEQRPRAPEDVELEALLGPAPRTGRALDLGCGVGRGVFVLAAHGLAALGVDRSVARVRRARGLAATREGFRLRSPAEPEREIDLDLALLSRDGVDFAVADAAALPLADASFDVVVHRVGDGRGPWADPERVAGEVARVLRPGGVVLRPGMRA